MLFRLLQLLNADAPIATVPSGMSKCSSAVQPLKAPAEIRPVSTSFCRKLSVFAPETAWGITTFLTELHPWNASTPISEMESGRTISESDSQP